MHFVVHLLRLEANRRNSPGRYHFRPPALSYPLMCPTASSPSNRRSTSPSVRQLMHARPVGIVDAVLLTACSRRNDTG